MVSEPHSQRILLVVEFLLLFSYVVRHCLIFSFFFRFTYFCNPLVDYLGFHHIFQVSLVLLFCLSNILIFVFSLVENGCFLESFLNIINLL